MMNALVYRGPGQVVVEQRPKPIIQSPTDAIVRMQKTTICGTDLHILNGDVPTCPNGRILGHEGVGIVESVGSSVASFKPGDEVIIACITSCATCEFCRRGMPSHCKEGGWTLGHTIDGTQAEYVRIPHAQSSLHSANVKGVNKEVLVMISDALPTGFECGTVNGNIQPGSTVAVIGGGPVGLSALLTAQFYSPSTLIMIDLDENRLATAKSLGATHSIKSGPDTVEAVMEITEGRGVDTVVEAVGIPKTFELCQEIVAVGGTIANLGVHGTKADIHLEKLWSMNLTIRTRLVDAVTIPRLIKIVEAGRIDPQVLITHPFKFSDISQAYSTFGAAAQNNLLKVVINFD
ncbi:L-iditol 2-dehydrogenase [Dendrothele bispora CBS 962.96]|uniref:L-iditol 2-dehydrogenase n=1 Tax=Dendrothele bispora (strain CBS 962.96) TaxID=1314807 RepID=A0A4S8L708_DENBC|nr:L-iditol 2-dehydrogenase [Dendrothele bispora CBS 962.96]